MPLTYYAEPHLIRIGDDRVALWDFALVSLVGPTNTGHPTNIAISFGNSNTTAVWDNAHSYLIGALDDVTGGYDGNAQWSAVSEMHAGGGLGYSLAQNPMDLVFSPSTGTRDIYITWNYSAPGQPNHQFIRMVSYDSGTHVLKTEPVGPCSPS